MRDFDQTLADGYRQWGEQFDPSELLGVHSSIRDAFESGARVEVTGRSGDSVRLGRVGKSTGWRPVFLLMPRINSSGSSDVLGPTDIVTSYVAP